MPKLWYILIFIVFFILGASFIVWRDEFIKAKTLEKELLEEKIRNKPKLIGEIDFIAVAPAGINGENSIVTIGAIIRNTGAPSIVYDLTLSVKTNNKEVNGIMLHLDKAAPFVLTGNNNEKVAFNTDDNLNNKGIAQPVVTGGALKGFCTAILNNVKAEEIRANGLVMLGFKDVFGNIYSIDTNMNAGHNIVFKNIEQLQKGK